MALSLSLHNLLALTAAMAALAAVPSVSVLAVAAQAASYGFVYGAFTAAGVVLGDILWIGLAVFGLALLVEAIGPAFVLVKYAGGAYLLWLSVVLWRSSAAPTSAARNLRGDRGASFVFSLLTGLLITLGDQKAVLFYLGFLPAFVNVSMLTALDVLAIGLVAIVAVGGVKLVYAYLADKAGQRLGHRFSQPINRLGAIVLLGVGLWIVIRP